MGNDVIEPPHRAGTPNIRALPLARDDLRRLREVLEASDLPADDLELPGRMVLGFVRPLRRIIGDLRRAVAAHSAKHHDLIPLMMLVWSRLGRMDARFQALVARVCAGLQAPAARPAAPRRQAAGSRPAASPLRLSQSFAWLIRLMPYVAAGYGSQLQYLLADPDMPALLAAEPRLGHILRPLCHMLAIRPTLLKRPPRPRRRTVAARAPAAPGTTPTSRSRSRCSSKTRHGAAPAVLSPPILSRPTVTQAILPRPRFSRA